jgi:hypothetical protein
MKNIQHFKEHIENLNESDVSKYRELAFNPPKLVVKPDAREIIINLISSMGDNKYKWIIKKNDKGDFKINTVGQAFSNFQTEFDKIDIEWEADDNNWEEVFKMINSGTSKIESVRSR